MSAALIAIVLIACSMSGLAAGVYARHLGDPLAVATTGPRPAPSQTPLPAVTATPVAQATATTTPQSAVAVEFALSVSVSPTVLSVGETFTITVTAVARHGGAPVAGLQCFMRAPSSGRAPLFQDWPPPQVTAASGQATWQLTAPQQSPGLYGVEVVAYGTNSYNYYADSFVTVSG
ncbi:MAG: hypothetical protein ACRDHP_15700 [Ktedonobacterales bacterium]